MSQHSPFLQGWLASEKAAQDVISVKRAYIDINDGNLHDGLLFSQIMYWHGLNKETHKPRLTVEKDGELWLVKSYTEWWDECRINEHTARKCISRIAERGLIVVNLWKYNGAPTIHLRINWGVFENKVKSICYDVSNPIDTTGQNMDLIPQVISLTETTTETTTDIAPDGDKPKSDDKKKRVTAHYAHYLALIAAFGYDETTMPKRSKSRYMEVAVNLLAANFPVESVKPLYDFVAKLAEKGNWSTWGVNVLEDYAPRFLKEYKPRHAAPAIALPPPAAPDMTPVAVPAYDDPNWKGNGHG